ncbi:MAG: Stp1/IreP family PP2C-type Ser/Thr phosphatase [Deltaproteobacteria bacterium]|nr:Stp1/IreP family PP2C-type Ser/Thr phosphatase [Deltaproteobacteria bacterium]
MILESAAGTDVGLRRSANEDRYIIASELGLYLVADGMGGHTAGQVASDLAAQSAVRALETLEGAQPTLAEKLRYAVAAANREIYDTAQEKPHLAGMGTTLVAVLAGGHRIALAHVGDSRAYLIRSGKIRQLTDDHSLVAELVRRREITAHAARDHPHRHVLTRALGVRRAVEPDLAELSPAVGDLFVLCSDGLTGHVLDEEIAAEVSSQGDLDTACANLIALANSRGGSDNTTVMVVRCKDID